jgi:predicted nuclease with TOPRIM domain
MSKEPAKPADSLVQQLLAERRELKVALERARLEMEDVKGSAGGPDPRVAQLQAEVTRLRTQLDGTRAEVNLLKTERDELRDGIERAIAGLKEA